MVKSMTGFGRCEVVRDSRKYTVELKSVNHRYLDVGIRMPKKFNFFETAIRNLLKQYAGRGKIDVFITYEDTAERQVSLKYNEALAGEYLACLKKMEETFGLDNDIRVSALSRYPDVITMEEQTLDEEEIWNGLKEALEGAFGQFVETRTAEGGSLEKDILEKLDFMEKEVAYIEGRAPEIVSEYRKKLEEKVCTDEEIVRLKSHIAHMRSVFKEKGEIGRKLDFIAQEMNRESNTILSKANDLDVSNHAINLKTEIEKVREQIQNIE